jgi:hypothetical protein
LSKPCLTGLSITLVTLWKIEFKYNNATFGFSTPMVFNIFFLVGTAGGIYGIGGGFI